MDITTLQKSYDTLTVKPRCTALVVRNAADFARSLMPMQRQGLRLEIDLSSVRHVDGAGLGALMTCGHAMQRGGCQMVLTHIEKNVEAELQACGLGMLLGRATAQSPYAF